LETPDENLAHLMQIVKKIAPSILRAVQAEGFNLGVNTGSIAGQVIFHIHIHVMPRFPKDGHDMWHEKEIGDLTNIAERIRKEIQK
jgi:histidine triad (HIT) family protein